MKRLIYILLVLLLLPIAAGASNVVQVVRITDTSGSPVSGVSFTAGGVALTAGTSATTVPGVNLDTGAALTNQTLKYYDPADGSGEYFFIFDPATNEAHFLLVATKNGVAISNATVGLNFFADPSTLAATNTRVATALPAAAPGGTGGLPTTNSSNQVAVSNALPALDGSNRVTLTPAEHTSIQADAGTAILVTPSQKLATDSSGSPVLSTAVMQALRDVYYAKMIDGSLNAQDVMVLDLASIVGAGSNTFNATTHVNTGVRKRQDGATTAFSTATQYGASQVALPATGTTTTVTTPLH